MIRIIFLTLISFHLMAEEDYCKAFLMKVLNLSSQDQTISSSVVPSNIPLPHTSDESFVSSMVIYRLLEEVVSKRFSIDSSVALNNLMNRLSFESIDSIAENINITYSLYVTHLLLELNKINVRRNTLALKIAGLVRNSDSSSITLNKIDRLSSELEILDLKRNKIIDVLAYKHNSKKNFENFVVDIVNIIRE